MSTQEDQAISQIDPKQNFEKIIINSPLGQSEHTNLTFEEVSQKVNENLQTLLKSSFYKGLTVHMGAKPLTERSYIEDKYRRQHEVLALKIQETKKNIFKISSTNDQEEFDKAMLSYQDSMAVIRAREQQVEHVDFVPEIYIESEKKMPFYGHLMQEFNRKGAGTLNVKIGYRAPFAILDKLEMRVQTPLNSLRRKHFNFDLEWQNAHKQFGSVFTKYSHANESLYQDIDQKSHAFNFGVDDQRTGTRIQLENKFRNPFITKKYDEYCLKNYHLPTWKSALKVSKVWENSIQFNDINVGKYLEMRGQLTVPFLGKSQFAKLQLNYRKFHDIYSMKSHFEGQFFKKMFYGSSLQTNASFRLTRPFSNTHASDVAENMEIRGFDQPRVPNPSFSNSKFSAKFNIHNFPVIGQARLTPFLFAQSGFSFLDTSKQKMVEERNKKVKFYGLGSIGMGLAYYVNPVTQIQLIYCLGQYQNLARRQPTNFQIRIGVFD